MVLYSEFILPDSFVFPKIIPEFSGLIQGSRLIHELSGVLEHCGFLSLLGS